MAINPLVRQLGLGDLLKKEAETVPEPREIVEAVVETALTAHVRQAWSRNKLAKTKIDEKLLECLRSRRGVFSPAQIAQMQASNGGMNMVWVDLTETKCRAASAWIREIVLPVGEQPWGIDPTPMPDLPFAMKSAIVDRAVAQAQQTMAEVQQAGGGVMDRDQFKSLVSDLGDRLRADAEKEYVALAKKKAKRMERVLADRLAQGGYASAMDGFIEDFVTYPAAILKGPVYQRHKSLSWGAGWTPKVANNPVQTWERVSPFDIYPAPGARSPDHGDLIERIRFRRDELYDLRGLPGYKDDQIDAALKDYSEGRLEGWLWTESERQRLEQETLFMYMSPPGVIDALSYWGSVPGWKLMLYGLEGLEATQEYECNVVLCGSYLLYATLNPDPLHQRPYYRACYDEIPGAFWGRSIPDLAATSQKMCNAAASALADNMAISSGPQIWVHADRFADGEQTVDIFPWKVWQLKSDPTQGVNPGIGHFQPPSNAAELMGVLEKWEIKADDTTGIPRYTYGNERAGGSADTATGLSMLMNNAAKGLRRAIGSIDSNVISRTINTAFSNEMLYNPDNSIKGDCVVVPRGASAVLIRESMQQRRMQYLTIISNPLIAQTIGPKYLINTLREVAAAMDLPLGDVIPSEDEFEKSQAAQARAAQEQAKMQMEADAGRMQLEHAFEMEREEAISQRDANRMDKQVIADAVRQAVQSALQSQQPAANGGAGAGGRRKLAFKYGDDGQLMGAEEE